MNKNEMYRDEGCIHKYTYIHVRIVYRREYNYTSIHTDQLTYSFTVHTYLLASHDLTKLNQTHTHRKQTCRSR